MNGWRYEWIDELPEDVYEVLIEMMKAEAVERETEPT
jgi:hypothetical protein